MDIESRLCLGKGQDWIKLEHIVLFKEYLISNLNLDGIKQYLPMMGKETFFLLAATGLGKTVVTPVHNWLNIFLNIDVQDQYNYDD
ncbi:MAG: hypothetical protein ACRCXZ_03135, partial [Patescibacteria group bacterium]